MGGKPKYTLEQVKKVAEERDFIVLETEYMNNSTPMLMGCPHGHEFKISFQNLKKGRGCSQCYKYKKLTHEEVKEKCIEKGFVLKTNYINAQIEIIVECENGHEWSTTWAKIQQGRSCPYCTGKYTHIHDVKSNVEKEGFTLLSKTCERQEDRITICCPKHHIYETTYGSWVGGRRCPHCNTSKGEKQIAKVLKEMNIEFIQQHTFDNCCDKRKLPFDFYLPQYNLCIEYDGRGHYEPIDWGGRGGDWAKENLEWVQNHDIIKDEFCRNNNILLLRIPYWEDVENTIKLYFKENFND